MSSDGRRPLCPVKFVFIVCGILLLSVTDHHRFYCSGQSLNDSNFYPFNISTDQSTPNIDDGGSGRIQISTTFNFFDKAYNTVYVSNNGIISFNKEFSDRYQPQTFPLNGTALVAPFWADVDIEKVPGGHVWYGENNSTEVLQRASCDIRIHRPEYSRFKATWVFVSTWFNVGYFGAKKEGLSNRNTFQAVLITDGYLSFVMFNYHRIEWTTGKNSEGDVNTGLGGEEAQAGYNAECCNRSKDVAGSATEAVINLTDTSNVNLPGRQLFELSEPSAAKNHKTDKAEPVKVYPTSGSMLGGEKLTVSGVCFPACCSVINAMYVEWNVTFKCRLSRDRDRAECVLPSVFRTGTVTLRFTQELSANCDSPLCGKDFNESTPFSIYNFIRIPPKVKRMNPGNWIFSNNMVTVQWDSSEFRADIRRGIDIEIALLGYKRDPAPSWEVIQHDVIKDTVMNQIQVNLSKPNSNHSTYIVRVAELIRGPNLHCDNDRGRSLQNCAVKAIWSDQFALTSENAEVSRSWCQTWITRDKKLLSPLTESQPCPTTYTLAKNDIAHFQMDPFCDYSDKSFKPTCEYVSKVKACFRLVSPLENGGDQVCCYGDNGDLMSADDLFGWGTRQRYHFDYSSSKSVPTLDNFENDILAALHCRYFNKDSPVLQSEYDLLRPRTTTTGYEPPKPAQCAGDPHIVTLDGQKYTFNGVGEYVFTQDTEKKCVIQIRTKQAVDVDNNLQNASIIDAIAMGGEGKEQIEVRRLTQGDRYAEVLVGGTVLDISTTQDLHVNGLSLSIKRRGGNISSILVVFDKEGLSVDIEPTKYLLNVLLIVGSSLKGKLEGLLGNYNDKLDDDFKPRNRGASLGTNPTDKEIHEKFGLSWAVTQEESLFTYAEGMGTANHTDLYFKPYFLADLLDQLNETEIKICGLKNKECLFDLKTTKNEDIARGTLEFVKMFEDILKETKPVTRCDFPPDVQNATKNFTGLAVNETVIYTCEDKRETRVCQKSGNWSGTEVTCEKVLPPTWPSNLVLIASVSTAAGVVFIICIITITAYCCCKQREPKQPDQPIEIPLEEPSLFKNEAFLQQLQKITEDGSFKLPRPFLEDPKLYTEYF